MAKKVWTPEERKAFGEKMRAAKEAKNVVNKEHQPVEVKETIATDDVSELRREVAELKAALWAGRSASEDERVRLQGGKLVGTVTKYDLTPSNYPDPVERLAKEPKLARYAFNENYKLRFDVSVSEYTTIDNIRTREPKFTLELLGLMWDEETGEPVIGDEGGLQVYVISRLIMHEDPEAALVIAREQDLEVDEANEEDFLNEMRYIRMRDWLITCFIPAPVKNKSRKTEMVVGGKVVEIYEITADENTTVKLPFDKLSRKL